jgi:hypothetical protein
MARAIAITAVVSLLLCANALAAAPARTTPIVVKVAGGGFSLADAAIGAVAGAAGVIAITGFVALLRLRRESDPSTKGDAP